MPRIGLRSKTGLYEDMYLYVALSCSSHIFGSPKRRYHGDTFEIYPRNGGLEDSLNNMKMPINWNTPPTNGVDRNSRFLYPHVHLLPSGDWYLQQRK